MSIGLSVLSEATTGDADADVTPQHANTPKRQRPLAAGASESSAPPPPVVTIAPTVSKTTTPHKTERKHVRLCLLPRIAECVLSQRVWCVWKCDFCVNVIRHIKDSPADCHPTEPRQLLCISIPTVLILYMSACCSFCSHFCFARERHTSFSPDCLVILTVRVCMLSSSVPQHSLNVYTYCLHQFINVSRQQLATVAEPGNY